MLCEDAIHLRNAFGCRGTVPESLIMFGAHCAHAAPQARGVSLQSERSMSMDHPGPAVLPNNHARSFPMAVGDHDVDRKDKRIAFVVFR